ncbi:MAG TPA: hypothetical protein VFN60_02930 [Acidimicrobiales bacterium]|nr:hypothetical protein [Acidimicrobiales bacterium]
MSAAPVGVVLLYPDLLGTYGDSGNATILAQRLRWRGIAAEVHTVLSSDPVPASADLYVVGGGEDLPQALAARQLSGGADGAGPLRRAVDAGAAVLAVCAGLQILGASFVGPDGVAATGLGLLDATSTQGPGPRAVGELVVEPDPASGLPTLTGYENHAGVTAVGPDARPLGKVRTGVGNGTADGVDGVVQGRVVGTYLHGPVLARNPALADHLLASVVGPLAPLDDSDSDELRAERLRAASSGATHRRGGDRLARLVGRR